MGLLLAGVYRPSSGTIYLDGVDINVISDESRTEQIAFLSQDTFLLHDTIRNNLMFANDTSTEDQMLSACRKANIHELIESLPLGYDTVVGERAHQLSGGEKQKLAIARILLREPSVIILDEALAPLDLQSQSLVHTELQKATADKTVFYITHRLSTILQSDSVLFFSNGQLLAQGSHSSLVNECKQYRDLLEIA